LVGWVLDHRLFPGTTSGSLLTLRVWDGWCDPVSVFFIIPILGLDGLWVGNGGSLIDKPVLWFSGLLINNLKWCIFIPVFWLGSFWVWNSGLVNPILWLGVLLIFNLLWRVERWSEVLKKAALLDLFAVLLDDEGVVWVDNQGVELSRLDNSSSRWSGKVLLLVFTSLWVLVVDNEVDLVGVTALVGSEHDNVWRAVGELFLVESLVIS